MVGVGCRFPGGCNTPSKLWDLICEQRDIQSKIPAERYNSDAFYDEDGSKPGCTNVNHGYFLDEDIRAFDAAFFRMNPAEVEAVDPQQRMLLETVYEALESAGRTMDQLRGTDTAVYVGCMTGDYVEMLLRDPLDFPKYTAPGTARSILSNRISYFYDWHGPSMTIDTACSASLVAVHEAVQALRTGMSRVACAAGTNAILGPESFIIESKLQILSPTGRSRMWDAAADGYARGEGAAALMMKKLSHAIADGDEVYCLIRETGVNSDGRTNGITMPSAEAQAALIRQTYARAGLDPLTDGCQYFEAHGTGTQAGDPQEARAIHDVFCPDTRDSANPLYVGSVKTVIGHLEGAAGVAGLIKAAEAVRRAVVPPNMLLERLNPAIEPFSLHLKVPMQSEAWPHLASGGPRRASVNSFGMLHVSATLPSMLLTGQPQVSAAPTRTPSLKATSVHHPQNKQRSTAVYLPRRFCCLQTQTCPSGLRRQRWLTFSRPTSRLPGMTCCILYSPGEASITFDRPYHRPPEKTFSAGSELLHNRTAVLAPTRHSPLPAFAFLVCLLGKALNGLPWAVSC